MATVFGLTFASTIIHWAPTQNRRELNLIEQEIIHYQMFMAENT